MLLGLTRKHGDTLLKHLLEITALYDLSNGLNFNFHATISDALDDVEQLLMQTLDIDDFCIMLLDEKKEYLYVAKAGNSAGSETRNTRIRIGSGISGLVAKNREPIVVQDVSLEERFLFYNGAMKGIGSFLSIPIETVENDIIGVFNVHKPTPNGFGENDLLIFSATAMHIGSALGKSNIFEATQKLAVIDELTQLYSRRYFLDTLEREISNAKRYGGVLSLIMVDVDNFKEVNDLYGHQAGDEVLANLASIVKKHTRSGDIASRYGGDELMVLMTGVTRGEAFSLAEKLRSVVEGNIVATAVNEPDRELTVSIGVSNYPENGQSAKEIINYADKTLYCAKEMGRNKVCISIDQGNSCGEELRRSKRYNVGVSRRLPGRGHVLCVDICVSGIWISSLMDDVSLEGFRLVVRFMPEIGKKYDCKALIRSDTIKSVDFSARCVTSQKLAEKEYLSGFAVMGNLEFWSKTYRMIVR